MYACADDVVELSGARHLFPDPPTLRHLVMFPHGRGHKLQLHSVAYLISKETCDSHIVHQMRSQTTYIATDYARHTMAYYAAVNSAGASDATSLQLRRHKHGAGS